MLLSPAERQYLYDSLVQNPPIRPDARNVFQCRPLEATTTFLPSSNGSARLRMTDGAECIVSVKSKVVKTADTPNLLEVDVDVQGYRDDSNFVATLKYNLSSLLHKNFPFEALKLTSRYSYKLFIDCIVMSNTSYPLTIISMAIYLALKTTKLPKLVSEVDDVNVEEQPTFSDDWEDAKTLGEATGSDFQPPVFITLGVIGSSLLFDPSLEEEQVLENGLIVSFYDGKAQTPLQNINLALNSNKNNYKGLKSTHIVSAISMVNKYCGMIIHALDTLIDQDEGDGQVF
ncbi:hypothetical protein CANTEDRAFT_105839 [Yamadazyma tenuis ATCC 10573]|uniref:Ribosomal RNA-processing protein 42 n=1 Tax=Candida tenuis (strain ATCC 10573 / BCRC 21748 / CBS 615 / JCM 9827 / NBRC 10315 / NRRL Y-1498 / VKM Y-70) TaxID=590646 RepID=G3B6Q0_CANTC|nr:uncharacterized protein CANTEDRAFT_105839 [Yamadazyma tenuis ATCC 10573]EGV62986.1 hypothetical protein CANTEDRAFT_105839 [Yamadazyma tenuis ATCC 10573]